jgi:outer membrane lipoprotein-sorting protein|tara:strand:+ start:35509 stop:36138 length:630 start_codon:yes stop_codon:yes gene_type:complete
VRSRNNLINFLLLGLFSFFSLNGQNNGIKVLEEVMNNAMKIKDANYSFKIVSENDKDLFPISGELYIKKEKYFIDTEEIDQIFDGDKLYTIIHENEEIIVTSDSNTFFNFTPKQIFNFFKDDFEIEIEKSQDFYLNLIARNLIQEDLVYKIIIDSNLMSIKRIDIKNRDNLILNSFLTISYKYNLSLPSSLFKFDKNKFNDYLLIENFR